VRNIVIAAMITNKIILPMVGKNIADTPNIVEREYTINRI
jgi:hypothetical protein